MKKSVKGGPWTWERANRRFFLIRFILLLVVLCLSIKLAVITFSPEPTYEEFVTQSNNNAY